MAGMSRRGKTLDPLYEASIVGELLQEVSSSCEAKTTGKTNREEDKQGQTQRAQGESTQRARGIWRLTGVSGKEGLTVVTEA